MVKSFGLWSNSVARQVNFNRTKICKKNVEIEKFKCDILSNFQTVCENVLSAGTLFGECIN